MRNAPCMDVAGAAGAHATLCCMPCRYSDCRQQARLACFELAPSSAAALAAGPEGAAAPHASVPRAAPPKAAPSSPPPLALAPNAGGSHTAAAHIHRQGTPGCGCLHGAGPHAVAVPPCAAAVRAVAALWARAVGQHDAVAACRRLRALTVVAEPEHPPYWPFAASMAKRPPPQVDAAAKRCGRFVASPSGRTQAPVHAQDE